MKKISIYILLMVASFSAHNLYAISHKKLIYLNPTFYEFDLGYHELGLSSMLLTDFFQMSRPSFFVSIKKGKKWIEEKDVNVLF
jgi:hypothetical protein